MVYASFLWRRAFFGGMDKLLHVFSARFVESEILSDTACDQRTAHTRFFSGFCVEIGRINIASESCVVCLHDIMSVICFWHSFILLSFLCPRARQMAGLHYVFLHLISDFCDFCIGQAKGKSPFFRTGKKV